jgi:Coenzyme PQQ synthesis protein D (PqqD)
MAAQLSTWPLKVGDRSLLRFQVRIPQHVVYRVFPTETVLLNLQTEKYHGLNPTAGRMLVALEQAPSIAAAATQIAGHYRKPRAEVEEHMCELCSRLLDRGLIDLAEG